MKFSQYLTNSFFILIYTFILMLLLNSIIIVFQFLNHKQSQSFFVEIGFPYSFYYFNIPKELRGSSLNNFFIDCLIWFFPCLIVSFLIRRKNKFVNSNQTETLDD
jgi:EamA domain-containing membrane protein RarD